MQMVWMLSRETYTESRKSTNENSYFLLRKLLDLAELHNRTRKFYTKEFEYRMNLNILI